MAHRAVIQFENLNNNFQVVNHPNGPILRPLIPIEGNQTPNDRLNYQRGVPPVTLSRAIASNSRQVIAFNFRVDSISAAIRIGFEENNAGTKLNRFVTIWEDPSLQYLLMMAEHHNNHPNVARPYNFDQSSGGVNSMAPYGDALYAQPGDIISIQMNTVAMEMSINIGNFSGGAPVYRRGVFARGLYAAPATSYKPVINLQCGDNAIQFLGCTDYTNIWAGNRSNNSKKGVKGKNK